MRRMGINTGDHGAWPGSIRHPPEQSHDRRRSAGLRSGNTAKPVVATPGTGSDRKMMQDLTELLMALGWPAALVISVLAITRSVIVVARAGIRVEIFTRKPILIETGGSPLQAEVGKVRI